LIRMAGRASQRESEDENEVFHGVGIRITGQVQAGSVRRICFTVPPGEVSVR
jgi:hypothetical protein